MVVGGRLRLPRHALADRSLEAGKAIPSLVEGIGSVKSHKPFEPIVLGGFPANFRPWRRLTKCSCRCINSLSVRCGIAGGQAHERKSFHSIHSPGTDAAV